MQSPERSGILTPPLHTSAAVPFRWEQEPGKPLTPFLLTHSDLLPKCLKLPPRLLIPSHASLFHRSPSFSNTHTLMPRSRSRVIKNNGWFGSWRKKVRRDLTGGTHVFPSTTDKDIHMPNVKRSGSSSNLLFHPKSRVWASICEGLKLVVPWRSKKRKKDGSALKL